MRKLRVAPWTFHLAPYPYHDEHDAVAGCDYIRNDKAASVNGECLGGYRF